MTHPPRFWKHKETKEVIDHLTYSDLKEKPQGLDFEECDVTGELLDQPESQRPEEPDKVPEVSNEVNETVNETGTADVTKKYTGSTGIDLDEIEPLAQKPVSINSKSLSQLKVLLDNNGIKYTSEVVDGKEKMDIDTENEEFFSGDVFHNFTKETENDLYWSGALTPLSGGTTKKEMSVTVKN